MRPDFNDPHALIPQELDAHESRAYEERTAAVLREHLIGSAAGPVIVDDYDTTIVVPPEASVSVDRWLNVIIDLKG